MPTAKCSINGCLREFEHPTQKSADHAALVHAARIHKGHKGHSVALKLDQERSEAISPTLELKEAPKVDRRLKAWRHANPDKAKKIGSRNKRMVQTEAWNRYKRFQAENSKGSKVESAKSTKPKKQEQAPVAQTVNYCPCCGCNIKKVAMGMVIAERL